LTRDRVAATHEDRFLGVQGNRLGPPVKNIHKFFPYWLSPGAVMPGVRGGAMRVAGPLALRSR
jgi:hypothetical protein